VRRERDGDAVEIERTKIRLRHGIERSKALVAQYRERLAALRRSASLEGDRPLFRWDRPR